MGRQSPCPEIKVRRNLELRVIDEGASRDVGSNRCLGGEMFQNGDLRQPDTVKRIFG